MFDIINRPNPYVIAGYIDPTFGNSGMRVTKESLEADLPRFMSYSGKYADVRLGGIDITAGRVLPEYVASDGTVHTTHVDDEGLYAVVEIRTDDSAPKVISEIIKSIDGGELRGFTVSGMAEDVSFIAEEDTCVYEISKINLHSVSMHVGDV